MMNRLTNVKKNNTGIVPATMLLLIILVLTIHHPDSSNRIHIIDAFVIGTSRMNRHSTKNNSSPNRISRSDQNSWSCVSLGLRTKTWNGIRFLSSINDDEKENSSDDDDNEASSLLFYDDFADFVGGTMIETNDDPPSLVSKDDSAVPPISNVIDDVDDETNKSASDTVLSKRLLQLQQKELYQQKSFQRNWDLGNWQIRAFLLVDDSIENSNVGIESDTGIDASETVGDDDNDDNDEDKAMFLMASSISETSEYGNNRNMRSKSIEEDNNFVGNDNICRIISASTADAFIVPVSEDDTSRGTEALRRQEAEDGDDDTIVWVGRTDGMVYCIHMLLDAMRNSDEDDENYNHQKTNDNNSNNDARRRPYRILCQFPAGNGSIAGIAVAPYTTTVNDDDEDDSKSFLYTATKDDGGIIRQWIIDSKDDEEKLPNTRIQSPGKVFSNNQIQSSSPFLLKPVSFISLPSESFQKFLLSVDTTSFALWDVSDGRLVSYQNEFLSRDDDDTNDSTSNSNAIQITSADTDGTQYIYLGTSSGEVFIYSISSLLSRATDDDTASEGKKQIVRPCGRWEVSADHAVTSIKFGGIGSMGGGRQRSSSTLSTFVLYTGTGDGIVKQYEVLQRTVVENSEITGASANRILLEQWPKLPTQRIPNAAHIYQTKLLDVDEMDDNNTGVAVTAIAVIQSSVSTAPISNDRPHKVIISSYGDGSIRAWNTATGKELYTIDLGGDNGNNNKTSQQEQQINSLCLLQGGNVLVTDGMEKYICVHDFSIDNPEDDDNADYELDMPEYDNKRSR